MAAVSDEVAKSDWVDRYLLRYGPGTVLGGIISAYFYSKRGVFGIHSALPPGDYKVAITTFFSLGFLLCYLASAPVLVFHISRPVYMPSRVAARFDLWGTIGSLGIIFGIYLIVRKTTEISLVSAVYVSIALVAWLSITFFSILAYFFRRRIYQFYRNLAVKRIGDKTGFVESYRTMREHGTAFYIIFFELVLAIILNAAVILIQSKRIVMTEVEALSTLIFTLMLWVFPALFAWYVSGRIECDFIDDHL